MKTEIGLILLVPVMIISATIINFDVYDKFRSKPMTIWDSFPGQFPYYTHVMPQKLSPNEHADANVGGVIISKLWVVTVASATIGAAQFKILFGVLNLADPPKLTMISKHWVTYPGFNVKELYWQTNDICLLQLPHELSYNTFIKPINLDNSKEPQYYSGFEFVSCSYEKTKRGSLDLQWTFIMGVKDLACQKSFSPVYTSKSICTRLYPMRKQAKDACQWDGGSPLATVSDDGTPTLVGILPARSLGECTAKTPKEYIRIGPYYDWIKRTMSIYPPSEQSMYIQHLKTSTKSKTSTSMENDISTTLSDTPTMETELPTEESFLPAIETELPTAETDLLALELDFSTTKLAMPKKGSKKRAKKLKHNLVEQETDLPMTETAVPTTETDWPTTETDWPTTETDWPTTETDWLSTETELPTTDTDWQTTETEKPTPMSEFPAKETELPKIQINLSTTATDLPTTKTDLPTTKTDLPTTNKDLPSTMSNQSTTVTAGSSNTTQSDLKGSYKSDLAIPQFISAENAADEPFFADNFDALQPIANGPHLHPVKRESPDEAFLKHNPTPRDLARKRHRLAKQRTLKKQFRDNVHRNRLKKHKKKNARTADNTSTTGQFLVVTGVINKHADLGDAVGLNLPKNEPALGGKSAQFDPNGDEYADQDNNEPKEENRYTNNEKELDGKQFDTYTERSSYTLMIGDKPRKINLNVDVKLLMNDKNRRYSIG